MARETAGEFEYDVDRALVTGATGNVGSWVCDRLADAGVDVVGVDRERPPETRSNLSFRELDLCDQGETWETVHETDPDAVVHCAAVSNPMDNPGTRVFENNTESTYNALVAAGRAGAEVVWTSSQATYGALFAEGEWVPDYLPIDEDHPFRPEDPYGVSKVCSEEVAKMVARRYDVPVTTVRATTIHTPDERRTRPPKEDVSLDSDDVQGSFGSYVDVRDVARMVEAALAADREGHAAFVCAADENYLGPPTREIIEAVCGTLPERCDLAGQQAALSNAKAARELDWRPRYSSVVDDGSDADTPDWR